ncbi:MAG: alpha/beta hydrolase [Treponemataceae bacterium]|nr:alpha/beta hydrolase [Treponemataceae bacterium]
MEPLNIARNDFPASTAHADGMQTLPPGGDNDELFYEEDVVYIERDGLALRLQIIGPIDGRQDKAAVVFIPGSAFRKQNVKARVPQLAQLAGRGFVVALLEYRASDIAPFPAQALDAKAGIRFLKRNAAKYRISPEKIVVMGDSSGAHTAMMAAFTSGIPQLEEPQDDGVTAEVCGCIDFFGPVNFATMNDEPSTQDHRAPDSPEGREIGGRNVLDHPELVRQAAVTTYVSNGRQIPPIIIFHGANDELVPFGQSCELFRALAGAKKDAAFYKIPGAHHGGKEFWSSRVMEIVEQFIRRTAGA